MSISPPSDIVLDVAKAADPARYKLAAERLNALAASRTAATDFAETLEAARSETSRTADPIPQNGKAAKTAKPTAGSGDHSVPSALAVRPETADDKSRAAKAFRGFEASVLANFVEAMMPRDAQAVFGGGTAGEVWRSLLSEKIGDEIARAGGIGIARQLAATHSSGEVAAEAGADDSARGPTDRAGIGAVGAADALVAVAQRGFLATVRPAGVDDSSDGRAA